MTNAPLNSPSCCSCPPLSRTDVFVDRVMGEDSWLEETIRAVVMSSKGVDGLSCEREIVGEDVVRLIWR